MPVDKQPWLCSYHRWLLQIKLTDLKYNNPYAYQNSLEQSQSIRLQIIEGKTHSPQNNSY